MRKQSHFSERTLRARGSDPGALSSSREHMLQTLPTAAYACDADGLITDFNPAAVALWGRAPQRFDPVDRYCGSFKLFAPDGTPIAHAACWMALTLRDDKSYVAQEIVVEQPSGRRIPVLAYANPVHDADGQLVGAVNVLVDISARKALEEEVTRNRRDFEDFFEHGSLALHCVDANGIIVRANQAELQMLGYEHDEYVGQHISSFHADADVISDVLTRLGSGESLKNYEARVRCKDGTIRHVAISSNVLWDDGNFQHTRCFTQDITAQKEAAIALREANRRKDEFIALLSHELRNPLEPILRSVEYLRLQGPDVPDLTDAQNVIERQVVHMRRLIDDLMNVARITQGKFGIKKETVLLADLVSTALETARPLLDKHGHRLSLSLPDQPLYLDADPVRISQVFANLIGNAAKYGDGVGNIKVSAVAESAPDNAAGTLVLKVEDDGIGIEPDQLDRIFEMFVQLDENFPRSGRGLGIGLTLVKSIVEMHGGSIRAFSEGPGHGSTFVARLPLSSAKAAANSGSGRDRQPAAKHRVLVVDDHPDSALGLSRLLAVQGHETHTAVDGHSALEQVAEFGPDIVLLDIGLPDIDGYETCRRIRTLPGGDKILIVAITGWGQDDDKRAALAAGFDSHLTKPLDSAALAEILTGSGLRPCHDKQASNLP